MNFDLRDIERKFESYYSKLDGVYDDCRNKLEVIFRKKISYFKHLEKKNEDVNSIDSIKITAEHEQYLVQLRQIYNYELKNL